jgi:hypothetical protein
MKSFLEQSVPWSRLTAACPLGIECGQDARYLDAPVNPAPSQVALDFVAQLVREAAAVSRLPSLEAVQPNGRARWRPPETGWRPAIWWVSGGRNVGGDPDAPDPVEIG